MGLARFLLIFELIIRFGQKRLQGGLLEASNPFDFPYAWQFSQIENRLGLIVVFPLFLLGEGAGYLALQDEIPFVSLLAGPSNNGPSREVFIFEMFDNFDEVNVRIRHVKCLKVGNF
jgi:hypothetical protein